MAPRPVEITFLGHATFLLKWQGKTFLIDPWVMNNPACPKSFHQMDSLDVILITHGHFDHIGDAVDLARELQPQVVANYETCVWLEGKGVKNTLPMNKGGTQIVEGVRVSMVYADHSCGIMDGDRIVYGGEAAGYILEFEEGPYRIYHAGDTNVFGDMKILGELFQPDLVILPIGDLFTMGPKEAALAGMMLGAPEVIPMHYGTFPALTGKPDLFRELLKEADECRVLEMKPGDTI